MKDINSLIIKNFTKSLEEILKDISKNYDIDYNELTDRYINQLVHNKTHKKMRKNKQNAYTIFLKDKDIEFKIKNENKNITFSELSKLKGKIWREMDDSEKEKYKSIANEVNSEN